MGVWVAEPEQRRGYAFKALSALLDYAKARHGKTCFYYEADVRNKSSMKLLQKFRDCYEITNRGTEKLTTDSGKELELGGFELKLKECR